MSKFEKSDHWELPDSQKSQDECFHFSHNDNLVAGIISEALCPFGTKLLTLFQPQDYPFNLKKYASVDFCESGNSLWSYL